MSPHSIEALSRRLAAGLEVAGCAARIGALKTGLEAMENEGAEAEALSLYWQALDCLEAYLEKANAKLLSLACELAWQAHDLLENLVDDLDGRLLAVA